MRTRFLLFTLCSVAFADDPAYLNNLGSQLFNAGQYRAAEAPLIHAVELWTGSANEHSIDLEAALHNLAAVYLAEGRFAEAEPVYQRAIQLRQARVGGRDLSLLTPLTGLALMYLEWGKSALSKEIARQAISIAEWHQQDQTADAARGFASLGGILVAQGRFADARLWLGRTLTIREHLFGADNAVAADTLMQVALACQREHRWEEAEQTYHRALRIYQQTPDVVKRAFALRCLADVLSTRHKYDAADELLAQAAAVLGTNKGADRVELARVHASLADLRAAQKRYAEAVPLYRQALDVLEPAFGPENPQLLTILEAYARALRAGQDYATAAGIDLRTMKIRVSLTLRGEVSSANGSLPNAQ